MTDFELINKRLLQQDAALDHLKVVVKALEAVAKDHVPNFEEQFARKLVQMKHEQDKLRQQILKEMDE